MPVVRYEQDRNEVNCFCKYLLFVANFILWSLAILVLAVGIWSWSEKDRFSNFGKLAHVILDPAFVLVVIGDVSSFLNAPQIDEYRMLMFRPLFYASHLTRFFVLIFAGALAFVIGFTGCVGALRENTLLLKLYIILLASLLISEIICGILLITFKDGIKSRAADGFQTFIVRYREDPDQQNFIDWVQGEWLQCCGIEGPKDWDKNNYFNCSSISIGSAEACGVPFSCCKKKVNEIVNNNQCGYDVRKNDYYADKWTSLLLTQDEGESTIFEVGCMKALEDWFERNNYMMNLIIFFVFSVESFDVTKIINERGCLYALEDWIEQNLLTITSGMITSTFFKVVGIAFAHHLRTDIIAQKARWY